MAMFFKILLSKNGCSASNLFLSEISNGGETNGAYCGQYRPPENIIELVGCSALTGSVWSGFSGFAVNIPVRCTFEINLTAILYQYCGAIHLLFNVSLF